MIRVACTAGVQLAMYAFCGLPRRQALSDLPATYALHELPPELKLNLGLRGHHAVSGAIRTSVLATLGDFIFALGFGSDSGTESLLSLD